MINTMASADISNIKEATIIRIKRKRKQNPVNALGRYKNNIKIQCVSIPKSTILDLMALFNKIWGHFVIIYKRRGTTSRNKGARAATKFT